MRGAIPPLPQYAFMAWCSVKAWDNFTFTFYLNCQYFGYYLTSSWRDSVQCPESVQIPYSRHRTSFELGTSRIRGKRPAAELALVGSDWSAVMLFNDAVSTCWLLDVTGCVKWDFLLNNQELSVGYFGSRTSGRLCLQCFAKPSWGCPVWVLVTNAVTWAVKS